MFGQQPFEVFCLGISAQKQHLKTAEQLRQIIRSHSLPTHRLYKTRGSHEPDVFVDGSLVLHVLRKAGKMMYYSHVTGCAKPLGLCLEKAVSCRALHEMESAKVHAEPYSGVAGGRMVPIPLASQLYALPHV